MANVTIKDIPEGLYERLKQQAEANRRSVNQEVIRCIERVVLQEVETPQERLRKIRERRETPRGDPLSTKEIEAAIEQGRE